MQKQFSKAETAKVVILCAISVFILFMGFAFNTWQVGDKGSFPHFQRDTESLIMGRLAKSWQDGIFSAGGLTGADIDHRVHATWITPRESDRQYLAYFDDIPIKEYSPYLSQNGGQALMYSVLDRLIRITSTRTKYEIFQFVTALLSASALTLVVLWFYSEFGLTSATFVLASAALSQWLVLFGRNLWWSLWAFYLPMVALMYYLRLRKTSQLDLTRLGGLVTLVVFAKCFFNGYEYITTALVMMSVPFIYYAILDRVSLRQFTKGSLSILTGAAIAILISVLLLIVQIGLAQRSISAGIEHLTSTFEKRTYGNTGDFNSEFSASLEASTLGVVRNYVNGSYLDIRLKANASDSPEADSVIKIHYSHLIVSFFIMSLIVLFAWRKNKSTEHRREDVALVSATWFSILAPLSWFIIFKSHSYIHTHINYVVWQMPFTLFGFAVWGIVVGRALSMIRLRKDKATPTATQVQG